MRLNRWFTGVQMSGPKRWGTVQVEKKHIITSFSLQVDTDDYMKTDTMTSLQLNEIYWVVHQHAGSGS